MNRATARGSGCSVGWRHTLYLHHLAPPAHLHGLSFPSRLVAAYHTSVKRHSVLAMKSLYVRAHVRVKCVCARACTRPCACITYVCANVREAPGILYIHGVHTNYLFRQGVAYRSDGYWPIIRPIFGTDDRIWTFVLCQFFFFSLSLSLFCVTYTKLNCQYDFILIILWNKPNDMSREMNEKNPPTLIVNASCIDAFPFDVQYAQISRCIDKRKCIANICAGRDNANQSSACYHAEFETVFNIDD